MTASVELSVVAPVYNEVEGIEEVVRYWAGILASSGLTFEIVLANDGSTDGTLLVLERLAAEMPFLKVVSYVPNRGYGHALKTAIRASSGEMVLTLDSDGQFDLGEYRKLLECSRTGGLEFVTGYRMKKADEVLRILADRGLNLIVRAMFGLRLRDTNCAMKLIRGNLARSLNMEAS